MQDISSGMKINGDDERHIDELIEEDTLESMPAPGCRESDSKGETIVTDNIHTPRNHTDSKLWFVDLCMRSGALDCVLRGHGLVSMFRSSCHAALDLAMLSDVWFKTMLAFAAGTAFWVHAAVPH